MAEAGVLVAPLPSRCTSTVIALPSAADGGVLVLAQLVATARAACGALLGIGFGARLSVGQELESGGAGLGRDCALGATVTVDVAAGVVVLR